MATSSTWEPNISISPLSNPVAVIREPRTQAVDIGNKAFSELGSETRVNPPFGLSASTPPGGAASVPSLNGQVRFKTPPDVSSPAVHALVVARNRASGGSRCRARTLGGSPTGIDAWAHRCRDRYRR